MKYSITIETDEGNVLLKDHFPTSDMLMEKIGKLEFSDRFKLIRETELEEELIPF